MNGSNDRLEPTVGTAKDLQVLLLKALVQHTVYDRIQGTANCGQETVCHISLPRKCPFASNRVNDIYQQNGRPTQFKENNNHKQRACYLDLFHVDRVASDTSGLKVSVVASNSLKYSKVPSKRSHRSETRRRQ
ncbi:hypothetical protein OS493_007350 [Desmophyllum pertusum]|uniref:Uncharacterized protein n=1 Tax=Desmophyllum pertusum TaxID=174260 RepID=A0A9W9Z4K6_9CNID|nr:hypothetical protein OS493_007350 [Desmophyllum pertusum]